MNAVHPLCDKGKPLLITPREAALALAVSDRTLFSMTKRGEIPVIRIGKRSVRYSLTALEEWIESKLESTQFPFLSRGKFSHESVDGNNSEAQQ